MIETDCDKALFNIARVRRDFGGNSTVALTLTDRRAGDTTNTVVATDVRYVFGRMYYFEAQVGGSHTKDERMFGTSSSKTAPVWKVELDRTGRTLGVQLSVERARRRVREPLGVRAAHGDHQRARVQSTLVLRKARRAFGEHHDVRRPDRGSGSTTTSRCLTRTRVRSRVNGDVPACAAGGACRSTGLATSSRSISARSRALHRRPRPAAAVRAA